MTFVRRFPKPVTAFRVSRLVLRVHLAAAVRSFRMHGPRHATGGTFPPPRLPTAGGHRVTLPRIGNPDGVPMPWLYLLLSLGAMALAFKASGLLLGLCLLASLALLVVFVLKLAEQRIGTRTRDEALMLDPAEMRRLRELAEARKLEASQKESRP
ncbi:hypothetical protein GCM10027432_23010 [Lysobacter fragariae]